MLNAKVPHFPASDPTVILHILMWGQGAVCLCISESGDEDRVILLPVQNGNNGNTFHHDACAVAVSHG